MFGAFDQEWSAHAMELKWIESIWLPIFAQVAFYRHDNLVDIETLEIEAPSFTHGDRGAAKNGTFSYELEHTQYLDTSTPYAHTFTCENT